MVSIKRAISLVIISISTIFLFAIEPNLIVSQTFSDIHNLDFDLSFENLTIENIYGDEILVELYSNNRKKLPKLEEENGALYLKSNKNKLYPSDYCNIKIYIPYEIIFETINIENQKGQIIFQILNSEELTIKSLNGKIQGQEISATSFISLSNFEGQIDINTAKTETLSVKTTTGSIYISSLTADYFDSTTDSGITEISLASQPKASSRIYSKTGEVLLSFQNKSLGFDLIASSTSGIFRDEINNLRLTPRNEYKNSYFGGGPEIQIRTTSSNITLK